MQQGFLKKIFQKFNINNDTKFVSAPLALHFKLKAITSPTSVEKREYITHMPYTNAVGSLMYAIVCTRPDLSQTVSMISKYMHDCGRGLWGAVKWILRYIKGTIDIGLVFGKDAMGKQECIGYVDSNYTRDLDKPRFQRDMCLYCLKNW